jgi:hypothetical protein
LGLTRDRGMSLPPGLGEIFMRDSADKSGRQMSAVRRVHPQKWSNQRVEKVA